MESELNEDQIKIHRNYEFRIYPNDQQIALLENHFFTSNQAWNFYLDLKIKDLGKNKDLPKANRIYKKFNDVSLDLKNNLQSRNLKFNSGVVQDEMRKLDCTFQRFFSKKSEGYGFPKFAKSKSTEQSLVIRNQATSWTSDYLKIFKEKIKWEYHRAIPADAKFTGGIIKRHADGKYFVILSLTLLHELPENTSTAECGIDLNIKNISISDSTGKSEMVTLPNFSESKHSKRFKKIQQALSNRYLKKNFSKNTKKLQKRLNKINQKTKNQKVDFFHKLSHKIANSNYGRISIEDLNIKDMKESDSSNLNRLISDTSWGSLITKIKYKAEMHNVIVREINPAYSRQRCHECGHISQNNRQSQSDFHCKNCKHMTNADLNASLNILDYDKWASAQNALIARWSTSSKSKSSGDKLPLEATSI